MRVDTLKRLIRLVEDSAISELEIRRWWTTVRITMGGGRATARANPSSTVEFQRPQAVAGGKEVSETLVPITSPMVGTFYRAASPDTPPYVEVGDAVKPGQTVCIIEAMKLMNEIESEVAGEVVEILVMNEEPVEYGQQLLLIRPA